MSKKVLKAIAIGFLPLILGTSFVAAVAINIANAPPPKLTDDQVRGLCVSGRVCEVMGHSWEPGLKTVGRYGDELIIESYPEGKSRHCRICGKIQYWHEGYWE